METMRIAKVALMAGFLFTLAVSNIQVASAAGQTLAGIPTLHDGYWLDKIKDQTQVVYPYEREQCDGPLTCSHPDELYRGGGFVALTAGGQWIQISCPATTSVGIQLRGDDNDGWVRVSVDDHDIVALGRQHLRSRKRRGALDQVSGDFRSGGKQPYRARRRHRQARHRAAAMCMWPSSASPATRR